MTIYKGRQAATAAAPIGVRTTTADPIEGYITRMNNIMAQLLATRKKEIAIARLDILKQEIALMKEKTA